MKKALAIKVVYISFLSRKLSNFDIIKVRRSLLISLALTLISLISEDGGISLELSANFNEKFSSRYLILRMLSFLEIFFNFDNSYRFVISEVKFPKRSIKSFLCCSSFLFSFIEEISL